MVEIAVYAIQPSRDQFLPQTVTGLGSQSAQALLQHCPCKYHLKYNFIDIVGPEAETSSDKLQVTNCTQGCS